MKQHISLFTALPIASLEKSSLTARVREIGRTAGATVARPTVG
jgi:arsenate reductase